MRSGAVRVALAAATALTLLVMWSVGPVAADTPTTIKPTRTTVPGTFPDQTAPEVSIPSIIPAPNSGVAPKSATDRGGWAQYAVLGGIVVALGMIVALVARESRRAKRRQAEATAQAEATRSSTRSEPVADTSAN